MCGQVGVPGRERWPHQRVLPGLRLGAAAHGCLLPGRAGLPPAADCSGGSQARPVLQVGHLLVHLHSRLPDCRSGCLVHPACRAPPHPQLAEQLAADESGQPHASAVQPTLRLNLPEALQQQPPWLDLCSWCANRLQKVGAVGRALHQML